MPETSSPRRAILLLCRSALSRRAILLSVCAGLLALPLSCGGRDQPFEDSSAASPSPDATAVAATVAALPDPGIVGPPPPPGRAEDDPLEGRVWGLESLEGAAGGRGAIPGAEVNLLLMDGHLSGSAGCNTFAGRYTREGDALAFDEIAATELACEAPPGIMEQEAALLDALHATAAFSVSVSSAGSGGLILRDPEGRQLLRFIDAAARPRDALQGFPSPASP